MTGTIQLGVPRQNADLSALAGRLRYARRRAQMTQSAAAEAVGVSERTLSRYESGYTPSEATIDALADAYDVEAEWIRTGGPEDRPIGAVPPEGSPQVTPAPRPADLEGRDAPSRFYYQCPRCGRKPLKPAALLEHLQSPFCVSPLSYEDAVAQMPRAKLDPQPWLNELQRMRRNIERVRAEAKKLKGRERANMLNSAKLMEAGMTMIRNAGAENWEIPPEKYD